MPKKNDDLSKMSHVQLRNEEERLKRKMKQRSPLVDVHRRSVVFGDMDRLAEVQYLLKKKKPASSDGKQRFTRKASEPGGQKPQMTKAEVMKKLKDF